MKRVKSKLLIIMYSLLVGGVGFGAEANYKDVWGAAQQKMAQKDYAGARAECDRGLAMPGLALQDKFNLLSLKASAYERQNDGKSARAEYAKIGADPQANKEWKWRAGFAAAGTLEKEKRWAEAEKSLRLLLNLPELTLGERVQVQEALARVAASAGDLDRALQECEQAWALPNLDVRDRARVSRAAAAAGQTNVAMKWNEETLALPNLQDADKIVVYQAIADLHAKAHDVAKLKETIGLMLSLAGTEGGANSALLALGRLATRSTTPEDAIFAWETLLKQGRLAPRDKEEAYREWVKVLLRLRKLAAAKMAAAAAAADPGLAAPLRFQFAAATAGLEAIENKSPVAEAAIAKAEQELKPKPIEKLDALNGAGKMLLASRDYRVVRELVALADQLVKSDHPSYLCRFADPAPLGAGGWFHSELLKKKEFRETRFRDYDQKDADTLLIDISVERGFDADKAKTKAAYFENTAFYMVYDLDGWHIFVLCGEPQTEAARLDGGKTSRLEMYFAPGADQTYRQWVIDQGTGQCQVFDWNSSYRHFRSIRDFIKTETMVAGQDWGTWIFIPWEALYDQLPFDTGVDWVFEVIRWSPAGGISWSGGKVHQPGKWGKIQWEAPPAAQLLKIKGNLVRKAWSKYRTLRDEAVWHWKESAMGDRQFYDQCLAPAIERLDRLGEPLKNPASLDTATINTLFESATAEWMEFSYRIAELRAEYLAGKVLAEE